MPAAAHTSEAPKNGGAPTIYDKPLVATRAHLRQEHLDMADELGETRAEGLRIMLDYYLNHATDKGDT